MAVKRNRDILDDLLEQVRLLIVDLKANELEITFPQRLNALIAIGRILVMERNLRRDEDEPDNLGITVRKYERAFASAANDRGRRKEDARPKPRRVLVSTDDDADDSELPSGDDPSA